MHLLQCLLSQVIGLLSKKNPNSFFKKVEDGNEGIEFAVSISGSRHGIYILQDKKILNTYVAI